MARIRRLPKVVNHPMAVLALLMAFLGRAAEAQAASADGARLEYARTDGAASCPDEAALKAAVAKRLGYDPFLPAAHRTVVVEIANTETGLRGQMRLVDAHGIIRGSRELNESLEHCDELVASLALAISIALDPSAVLNTPTMTAEEQANEALPEPTRARASAPLAPPPRPPASAKPTPAATPEVSPNIQQGRLAVRAGGFAALGAAPGPAVGVRLGASSTWGWFRLVGELSDQLPASKTREHVGRVTASLLSFTLAPCAVYASLAGCAVLDVGSLHVQGGQILDANSQRSFNATMGARFEFAPTLVGRLHLLTNIGVATALTPIRLQIHGQKLWDSPLLSANVSVGLAWRF